MTTTTTTTSSDIQSVGVATTTQQKRERDDSGEGEEDKKKPKTKDRETTITTTTTTKRREREEEKKEERAGPKRRVAVVFGYQGAGYNGLQMQPVEGTAAGSGIRTVETELHKALVTTGAISASNASSLFKVGWSRCARTDKGVSAAANVVGLNAVFRRDLLIRTHVGIAAAAAAASASTTTTMAFTEEEEEEIATRLVESMNAVLPTTIKVFGIRRVTGGFDAKKRCSGRTYRYVIPTIALTQNGSDEEGAAATTTATTTTQKKKKKEGKEIVKWLRGVVAPFVGTHNFHNFTVGKEGWEKSSMRYITRAGVVEAEEPRMIDGVEVVTVEIVGQSFMLLQVRKMIGFVLVLARGGIETEEEARVMFEAACQRDRVGIPAAPASGLFLERPHFDLYNVRFEPKKSKITTNAAATTTTTKLGQGRKGAVRVEDWEEEVGRFRDEVIVPHVAMEEKTMHGMEHFVSVLDLRIAMGYIRVTPTGIITPNNLPLPPPVAFSQQSTTMTTEKQQPSTTTIAVEATTTIPGVEMEAEETELAAMMGRQGKGGDDDDDDEQH